MLLKGIIPKKHWESFVMYALGINTISSENIVKRELRQSSFLMTTKIFVCYEQYTSFIAYPFVQFLSFQNSQ